MDELLKIKGLEKQYGNQVVLKDINLSVAKGEVVVVIGPSGCGKSMTAMSILRLLPKNAIITSGEIFFRNQDL